MAALNMAAVIESQNEHNKLSPMTLICELKEADFEQWLELERGIIPDDVAPWHEISDEQLGWKAVRMIGHRGCGKTSRPVIQST